MSDYPQRICDYEGSTYRTDFWEGKGRSYEDVVERQVLQQLLPPQGQRLLEIGAGFGRLTQEYRAYKQVVLLDYSVSQLQYARQQLGDDGYVYVAADAYRLPFRPGIFDGATMIRVIHHMENVPAVLSQIRQVMISGGTFILEHANKRNLKAMLRHTFGKNHWNPYSLEPVEFVELNYDFHPNYIKDELGKAGFQCDKQIPISFFRVGLLKNNLPTGFLAGLDKVLSRTGWLVSPSIFTQNRVAGIAGDEIDLNDPIDSLFRCPETRSALQRNGNVMVAENGLRWQIREGVYDFKAPVE